MHISFSLFLIRSISTSLPASRIRSRSLLQCQEIKFVGCANIAYYYVQDALGLSSLYRPSKKIEFN